MRSNRKLFLFTLIFVNIIMMLGRVIPQSVRAVSLSKEPLLLVNPVIDTTSSIITHGDEFDTKFLPNGTIYLLTTTSDYFGSYLTLFRYSPEWVLQTSISVLNRSESLHNPQICIGQDGSFHVVIGIENMGHLYLFSNNSGSSWFQTLICADSSIQTKIQVQLDELNQPHFAWLNNSNSLVSTLEYLYPTYNFILTTQTNTTFYNSTVNSTTISESSEIEHSFRQKQMVFEQDVFPKDFTFVVENLTHTQFMVLSSNFLSGSYSHNSSIQNGTHFSQIDQLNFQIPYSYSNITQSSLETYNFTVDENSTIFVEEWSNTTTFYSNLTEGNFNPKHTIGFSSYNETFAYPRMKIDSADQMHLFWLEHRNETSWIHYVKFDAKQNLILNNSFTAFTGSSLQLLNNTFQIFSASNFLPYSMEIFEGIIFGKTTTNSICLNVFHLTSSGLDIEPVMVFSPSTIFSNPSQFFFHPLYRTLVASIWNPLQLNFDLIRFIGQNPHFAPAYTLSASLQYTSKTIPSNLNSTVDENYSTIVVSDQRDLDLRVGISNFYDENCSCNLTLHFNSPTAFLKQNSAESHQILFLQNGTVQYYEWAFSFLEDNSYHRLVAVDLYSGEKFVDRFGFYVIVIPGINALELGFFIVGLMAFSSVFFWYKRVR